MGIWHETYLVKQGQFEAVYHNMPPYGLGTATKIVPASGKRKTATRRIGQTKGENAPVDEFGNLTNQASKS